MKIYKNIIIYFDNFFIFQTNLYCRNSHFLDFKFILNESDAGKKAQEFLKNKLENGIKILKKKKNNIQDEEKNYSTKKIISAEEYKKKLLT